MDKRKRRLLCMLEGGGQKSRWISGVPPLSFRAFAAGELENYRIYGNTVGGESVGDRTENLFDGEFLQGYWAYADGAWLYSSVWITTKKIPCKSSTTYTFSFNRASRWYGFVWFDLSGNYINTSNYQNESSIQYRSYSATSPPNAAYMAIDVASYPSTDSNILPNDITDFMLVENSTPLPYEPYGYKVPVTVEGKNLFDGEFLQGYWAIADGNFVSTTTWVCTNKFKCKPSTTYTFSFNTLSRWYGFTWYDSNGTHISSSFSQESTTQTLPIIHTATSPANAAYFAVDIGSYPSYEYSILPTDVTNLMLVEGSTPLPYEPYHAPVTTPIYLPEQIRKVGDEAEYIDYSEQKMHRIGADDINVTLPALPTLPETNVLSVGTAVQPSEIEVKGKIKDL